MLCHSHWRFANAGPSSCPIQRGTVDRRKYGHRDCGPVLHLLTLYALRHAHTCREVVERGLPILLGEEAREASPLAEQLQVSLQLDPQPHIAAVLLASPAPRCCCRRPDTEPAPCLHLTAHWVHTDTMHRRRCRRCRRRTYWHCWRRCTLRRAPALSTDAGERPLLSCPCHLPCLLLHVIATASTNAKAAQLSNSPPCHTGRCNGTSKCCLLMTKHVGRSAPVIIASPSPAVCQAQHPLHCIAGYGRHWVRRCGGSGWRALKSQMRVSGRAAPCRPPPTPPTAAGSSSLAPGAAFWDAGSPKACFEMLSLQMEQGRRASFWAHGDAAGDRKDACCQARHDGDPPWQFSD